MIGGSNAMRLTVMALAGLLLAMTAAHAEKRIALVVGNDVYQNLAADQQLRKAVNDSRTVAVALESIGFEVIRGENLGRQQLVDRLDEMTRRLGQGDVAFFFFAGHGVSINGGNYVLPSDIPNAESGQEMRVLRAAYAENDIVADLQAHGVRVAVVVLDSCRNNPFRRAGTRSLGAERGLARIDPVRGVFSLYSAGVGQAALDRLGEADTNPNSVFTRVLAPALVRPGLDLSTLAVEVREEVAKLAGTVGHDQRPAYYDETIGGRVYLAGVRSDGKPDTNPAASRSEAERAWASVQAATDLAILRAFEKQFGDTFYGALARSRIAEIEKTQVVAALPSAVPAPSAVGKLLGVGDLRSALSGNLQVDPDVLRTVQTHSFFSNAPPVRVAAYRVRVRGKDSENQLDWTLRSLNGILQVGEAVSNYSSKWIPSGTYRSLSRGEYFTGAGIVTFGSAHSSETDVPKKKLQKSSSTSILTKVDQLEGAPFPMAVGKTYRYRTVERSAPANSSGDMETLARCEVESKLAAAQFHRDLKGDAFVIGCELQYSWSRSSNRSTSRSARVFFPELGTFISADAIDADVFRTSQNFRSELVSVTLKD
jgi:hypothetical protein